MCILTNEPQHPTKVGELTFTSELLSAGERGAFLLIKPSSTWAASSFEDGNKAQAVNRNLADEHLQVPYRPKTLRPDDDARAILDGENPGQNAMDPQHRFARADFYQAEDQRLDEEEQRRPTGSITPGIFPPDFLGNTELDRARAIAENETVRLD
ncbi:hypothetical protein MMC29_007599 [Sticta canariensis]|nr:hypothetical protein [Sticta canariensis]